MIDFKNPLAMFRSLAHFGNETEKRAKRELKVPAEVLLHELQSQLSRPGSGKVYGRGRLGSKRHQASKPGEPPSPDTRELLRSAKIENQGDHLKIGVEAPGALALEFGSRDGKLQPRPYLRAALAAARERMTAKFVTQLRSQKK